MSKPTVSILTPSYRSGNWLRLCVESVADQQGVEHEHIVHDSCSDDGTGDWLSTDQRVLSFIERDNGMYDAINRGWDKARGEFIGHLNSDEQYLPGALQAVVTCFRNNPKADLVIGGTLMCAPDGGLLAYRKPLRPWRSMLTTNYHTVPSCSIFLRRDSFADRPFFYDPKFRIISDALFMVDALRAGKRIALLYQYTSAFFWTGTNLGLHKSPLWKQENEHQHSLAPGWLRPFAPLIRIGFRMRKLFGGHYLSGPIEYGLFTPENPKVRRTFMVERPSGVYRPSPTVYHSSAA